MVIMPWPMPLKVRAMVETVLRSFGSFVKLGTMLQ